MRRDVPARLPAGLVHRLAALLAIGLGAISAVPAAAGSQPEGSAPSQPVAVSSATADRQALVVTPAVLGGTAPARLALAQADANRYRDLLRLLGFAVTLVQADTRPDLKSAFADFARQVKPGGEVAVFVLGAVLPKGEELYLVPSDAIPPLDLYASEGLRLADALRPIADSGARETVLVVDECHEAQGQGCRIDAASFPERISAIVAERVRPSGSERTGLASLRTELLPLMEREGLTFSDLFGTLEGRLAGSTMGVEAPPKLTSDFAFLPAGFLAGLPTACNRVDPAAEAEAVTSAAPVEPLVSACVQAAATWAFSPRFRERLAAAREQAAFQHAAEGCRPAVIRAYLDDYPHGRYAPAVRGVEESCEAERRRAEAPPPEPELPPQPDYPPQPQPAVCRVGGLDPAGNNWLALRSAPTYQAPWSTTRMGPGTVVGVIGRAGEWVKVRLASGETGWANGKFLFCGRAAAPPERDADESPSRAGCVVGGLDPAGNNWLALRYAPSFQAPWSQTRMGPGTSLSVFGRSGTWLHVRLRSGETGWANGQFVRCGR